MSYCIWVNLMACLIMIVWSPKEHSEVTVHCVSSQKFESTYDDLYNFGWRFHGTDGPPRSNEVMLKEGLIYKNSFFPIRTISQLA